LALESFSVLFKRNNQEEELLRLVKSKKGKIIMDLIRTDLENMIDIENQIL